MAERPEDLNLPITVVQRIIKESVGLFKSTMNQIYFILNEKTKLKKSF